MDDRLLLFLWVLAGTVLLGGLGACFGGITGAVARGSGMAPGTILGATVLRAFTRVSERPPSPVWGGVIVGAADGAAFLGGVGLLLGLLAGYSGRFTFDALIVACLAFALLAGGAVFFGVLAYGLIAARARAVGGIALGCLAGGILGAVVGREIGIIAGILLGAVLGVTVAVLTRPRGKLPPDDWRADDQHPPDDHYRARSSWDRFTKGDEP